jgi:hypothetical protein
LQCTFAILRMTRLSNLAESPLFEDTGYGISYLFHN